MKRKTVGYIVRYTDLESLDVPYAFSLTVPGGIDSRGHGEAVALFPDRASAAKAIRISELAARLAKERGEIHNEDFLPSNRKNIGIVRVEIMA